MSKETTPVKELRLTLTTIENRSLPSAAPKAASGCSSFVACCSTCCCI